jgi:hypothetical protein
MCDPANLTHRGGAGLRALTALAALCLLGAGACGGKGGATMDAADEVGDGALGEKPVVLCPEIDVDGGAGSDAALAPDAAMALDGSTPTEDEFGHNAPAGKTASSLGRVNVYEIATAVVLERVDVYLRADMDATRVTIAIQEATTKTAMFRKLADVQMDFATCQGWATSGPLGIPLVAGRYYAIGFDPNQVVTPFVNTDGDSVPIDGAFGRLIGSRTATTVSTPTLTWDKFTDKEYNRQRLRTSPREPDPLPPPDAGADGGVVDGATDGRG